jgi:hypothetical protein
LEQHVMEKLKYISLLVFATIIFIVGESHALPKDIQAIIDTAKNSHLTKEMHQTYWDWMDNLDSKNEKDSLAFTNLLSNWYPKINRLQLQFNREFMKSLKLTIKNKKITYSDGYEESYQKMKKESLNLPLQKGTKEYADAYRGMIESFKQSKDGVDQMFQYAVTGEVFTYPFNKDVQFKVDTPYVLAMEASIEEGWKNLKRLFNPIWGN